MALQHGFELVSERIFPELNVDAKLYRHKKTGGRLLSIVAEDENKCFNITFRTPPSNSTGAPHILEHSVLCGSRKYRLKEPFIELVKGSMKTFVNAMTGGEATYYPVASTNLKDFYNLIDVYLDAALYPLLTRHAFAQEGWRYELEAPDAEMIFKGVVFNEMKGYYASSDTLLSTYSQGALQPDTIYAYDSGGNPAEIPNLSYQELVDFHRTYYHPSNSWTVFYGDDPPEERLRLMDECFSAFERSDIDSTVALQPAFAEPRTVIESYPTGEENGTSKKSHLMINWLIDGGLDPVTSLAYDILAYIILQTPASPLRKVLTDSGLGDKVIGGMHDGAQMHFYAGLKGIAVGEEPRVEALILDTIGTLALDGIDPEMVEAALNTTEFRLRENNTGSFPRGLALGFRALESWIFDGDPYETMAFERRLQTVKERAAAGGYFESLLRDGVVNNNHRVSLVLQPDPSLTERLNVAETERLARERALMTPEMVEEIVHQTHELRRLQEEPDSPEALASIPSLTLADLDRENKLIPSADADAKSGRILYHDLFTNGIVYLDLAFNLHALPFELLPYVPLFGTSLLQLGTDNLDYVRLIQRIGQKTGGIWTQNINASVRDSDLSASWFIVRSKSLPSQTSDLLGLLGDMLLNVRLDNRERFRQIVLEAKAGYESALTQPAGFLGPRLQSRFNEAGTASEQMGGVSYYFFLRDLVGRIDADWQSVLGNLVRVKELLIARGAMIGNVTVDGDRFAAFLPDLDGLLGRLPAGAGAPEVWPRGDGPRFEGLTVPTQVNAIGRGVDLYGIGYSSHGSSAVITKYLRTSWLWEQVRMMGGAYGCGCGFDTRSGIFTFSSSQDPNLVTTLEVFDRTGTYLREAALAPVDVMRSIIGVVSDIDWYQLPDAKGYTALMRDLLGEDDAYRQKLRDEVLSTTGEHFRAFADVLDEAKSLAKVVAFGPASAFAAAREGIEFEVTPVL